MAAAESSPGQAADDRARRLWRDRVFSRHQIFRWNPPYASCKCGSTQWRAPEDMGRERQKDWLLDKFSEHRELMRQAKRKMLAERRSV